MEDKESIINKIGNLLAKGKIVVRLQRLPEV